MVVLRLRFHKKLRSSTLIHELRRMKLGSDMWLAERFCPSASTSDFRSIKMADVDTPLLRVERVGDTECEEPCSDEDDEDGAILVVFI